MRQANNPAAGAAWTRRAGGLAQVWLKRWRGSALLRPRLISVAHLLSGNLGNVTLMMASLAIATRALGQQEFGVMAVVLTIGRVCERFVRFESWQPLVRFVAAEEERGDPGRLASLYAYGLLLDIAGSCLAAILTVMAAWLIGPLVGLDPSHVDLVAIYALAIAFNIRGMASAALRLAGKFRVLAYIQLAGCLLRLALSAILLAGGAGLVGFVVVWTITQIFDALLFNLLGFRALRATGVPNPIFADKSDLPGRFPGFMRFAMSTNLSSMIGTVTHEMDTLLVSTFAGPKAAGLYYLSRRIARVAQTAGNMIQTVIYPDLARLWTQAGGTALRQLVTMLQMTLAAMALTAIGACWLAGKPALDLAFGAGYAESYPMLLAQLVAVMLTLHAAPARSALLAMNRPTHVLFASVASLCAFLIAAFMLVPRYGGIGANLAHVAAGAAAVVITDTIFWRTLRRRAAVAAVAGAEA